VSPAPTHADAAHAPYPQLESWSPACAERSLTLGGCSAELIYRTSHEDGYKLVAHPRLAGTGYTGRFAGRLMLTWVSAAVVSLRSVHDM
jgi:hypothetical protein